MAFGANWIGTEPAIYEWTFLINNGRKFNWTDCKYDDFICIGLKKSTSSVVWNGGFCEFDSKGDIYCYPPMKKKNNFNPKVIKFGKNSKIKMTLNRYNGTVSYCVDDENLGVAFTNIPSDVAYKMAVTVW